MAHTPCMEKLEKLHPKLREQAIIAFNHALTELPAGINLYITETYRTFAENDALYKLGRTLKGKIVTHAPGGHSWHNYGLALDFRLMKSGEELCLSDDNWKKVIATFEKYGFNSGMYFSGSLKLPGHLENKMGQTLDKLLLLHIYNKMIAGTPYVDF